MSKALQTREVIIAEGDVLDPEGPPPTQFRHAYGTFVNRERFVLISTQKSAIQAGQTSVIYFRTAYGLFRPERLMLEPEVASEVDIVDIKIGHASQLSLAGTVPGELFNTQNPHPFDLKMDVVMPTVGLSLTVRNKKPYAISFSATFGGKFME